MALCASLPSMAGSSIARLIERRAQQAGHALTIGVDEAGVGTIAGPLVAAAVLLPTDAEVFVDADSKAMSRNDRRDAYARLVRTPGLYWACGIVDAAQVDALGDARASTEEAICRAAARLEVRLARDSSLAGGSAYYIVDGEYVPRSLSGEAVVRADEAEACVAAASILASAVHETCMQRLSRRFPLWDLEVNLGWPSREHLHALVRHGPSLCHRRSCFPFARRAGKRMAFHPDRQAYASVQAGMRLASDSSSWAGEQTEAQEEEASDGSSEGALGEAERARRERYRAFCAASLPGVDGATTAVNVKVPVGSKGGRRRSRRARRQDQ